MKTVMSLGLVMHLGGPLDTALVFLGLQEPPVIANRCDQAPELCPFERSQGSFTLAEWYEAPEGAETDEAVGLLRSSFAEPVAWSPSLISRTATELSPAGMGFHSTSRPSLAASTRHPEVN